MAKDGELIIHGGGRQPTVEQGIYEQSSWINIDQPVSTIGYWCSGG